MVREIEEPDFKVIPIIKEQCQIPENLKQALRDKHQARFNGKQYEVVIKDIMRALSLPNDAGDLYADFQGPTSIQSKSKCQDRGDASWLWRPGR